MPQVAGSRLAPVPGRVASGAPGRAELPGQEPGPGKTGAAERAHVLIPVLAEKAARPPSQDWAAVAEAVQLLDPLECDLAISRLAHMNARADLGALVRLAAALLPAPQATSAFSSLECAAAMRDLGMVAGSIRRHGSDPASAVPELRHALAELGRRTGMVPRDTIYHYTAMNPPGRRRRTYTGSRTECVLQDSVRLGLPPLAEAIDHCRRLRQTAVTASAFEAEAGELLACVDRFVAAFDLAWQDADPDYFARGLRPYFEKFSISGQVLMGPAAAHVPVGLVDLALWASDDRQAGQSAGFLAEAARYAPRQWQLLYGEWAAGPSLVTRVLRAGETAPGAEPRRRAEAAARALAGTLKALLSFRGRHQILARQAYRPGIRLYDTGSGGGSLQLLKELTDLTRKHAARTRAAGPRG